MGEAREELARMLNEDELREAALLVFANKQVHTHTLFVLCLVVPSWVFIAGVCSVWFG